MTAATEAARIAGVLRRNAYQAWFVGGCVRDRVLGREPKDYDIATDATPEQVAQLFPTAERVGAHFGVMLVSGVEVATFRSDHGYADGRHPDRVVFERDPRQDALRRDFTINALMMDPESGEVLDFVGGRADLTRRVIRTVGEPHRRFAEDHLRMLRAVRFAARLRFDVDPATLAAIRELRAKIHGVSAERIQGEIERILVEGGARRGFELLDESGLLAELLPEVAAMKGVAQPPEFHPEGDVWTHTLSMLDSMSAPTNTLAWGVLLHDVAKPVTIRIADRIRFDGHAETGARMAREILGRFRCSNETIDRVEALVAHHLRFIEVKRMRQSTLKRFLRMDGFEEHLELHRLDCLSSHRMLANWEFMRDQRAELSEADLRPARLVTGHDLIACGRRPGPRFREILEAVETAQLEGTVTTREEALDWLREHFPEPGESKSQTTYTY